jgi:hypothetical protein
MHRVFALHRRTECDDYPSLQLVKTTFFSIHASSIRKRRTGLARGSHGLKLARVIRSKCFRCTVVLVLAVLFKLWLVAGLAITDDSDDPPNYVAQILHDAPNFFGPGTGVAGRTFLAVGIPFRMGMEIGYLAGCLLMVAALFGWPWRTYLALGVFLFAAFNATAAELFSHMLSDPVWLVEVMIGLALVVLFATRRSPWWWFGLVPAGVLLAVSTITRTTIVPLCGSLLLWLAIVLVVEWRTGATRRRLLSLVGGVALVLVAVTLCYKGTCLRNSESYGYYGLSMPDSREYREFYMALQSVGEPTGDRYYPVDTARLDQIAQAGPVSKWFVEAMKTDGNFRRVSEQTFGKYDFALGWFHFVVFFNAIPNGDLRTGFQMFRAVEDEIAAASREGRIKTRSIVPLPDARLGVVAGAVPNSVVRLGGLITFVPAAYAWSEPGEPRFQDAAFTKALNRGAAERSPVREAMGMMLCAIYGPAFVVLLPVFLLALGACVVGVIRKRGKELGLEPEFAARQLILIAATVFFAWNVLFCASGVPFFARYMILQNVLLPLLAVYYARAAWHLLRKR